MAIAVVLLLCFPTSTLCSNGPSHAKRAMVVSPHERATEIGLNILKRGGNAVDAAVAVGFALAVVYPEAGNIGGGGFMLVRKSDGTSAVIDFRETAPGLSTRTMYLDSTGNTTDKSFRSHLSVAVPGTVAGFVKASLLYGRLRLRDVIQPAIDLAERGFIVDHRLAAALEFYKGELLPYESTAKVFFKNGNQYEEGELLRQPDLAKTLRRIQRHGMHGFYRGETARLLVEEMRRGGGIITNEDLQGYEAVVRQPLQGSYRGFDVLTVPPPSSGGICLIELLNIVEGFDLRASGFHSSRTIHRIAEAMKRVFADRSEFIGDPKFSSVPSEYLTSKDYATQRRSEIDTAHSTSASRIRPGVEAGSEGKHTTQFVVADEEGNVVSTTYTLNDMFGSKIVVKGAGFLLNNTMDDFSIKPGVPNFYGLVGGDANAIAPGKRPLSSMSPTIVLKDRKPMLALGARGGPRIITSIFLTISNIVDYGMDLRQAIDAPRFHHQWLPDTLLYEKYSMPEDVARNLSAMGYALRENEDFLGRVQALFIEPITRRLFGVPDAREGGSAAGY